MSEPFALLTPESSDGAGDPVVVLLGWAGADRDKAVLKYAEVLAQRGYASVRSVQPLLTAFSPLASARRRWALALLRYLEEQHLWPQRRLVLFAFSNGGLYVVEQLMLIAESDPRYARLPDTIAALVVDSAPVMADPRSVASVVEASTPPGWRRWLLARYIAASARLRGVDGGMQAYVANLRRLGWGKPQLFLYSRDDPIARADKIDQLVEAKLALGQDVRARCWENVRSGVDSRWGRESAHCAHLKHHPEEYRQLLFGLLEEVQARRSCSGGGGSGSGSSSGGAGRAPNGGSRAGGGGAGTSAAAGAPRARL